MKFLFVVLLLTLAYCNAEETITYFCGANPPLDGTDTLKVTFNPEKMKAANDLIESVQARPVLLGTLAGLVKFLLSGGFDLNDILENGKPVTQALANGIN